jgi:uncharacterized protein YggE
MDIARTIISRLAAVVLLVALPDAALAGERFASTLGTVQRELSADRVALLIRAKAVDKIAEASNAKLEVLLKELKAEAAKLEFPETAFSLRNRATQKEWEGEEREKTFAGFSSWATLSVVLTDLANYHQFLTFLGTNDGMEIVWISLGSSKEGEARKQALAEALGAARAKAEMLAAEGGAKSARLLEVTEEEVGAPEFGDYEPARNAVDPNEGKGIYPIRIIARVRAKYELLDR